MPESGKAYRLVSCLPNEMIEYELESQGIKSSKNFVTNKTKLSNLFDAKWYKLGKQQVALGYPENITRCENYLRD